jgi:hypothetical protein
LRRTPSDRSSRGMSGLSYGAGLLPATTVQVSPALRGPPAKTGLARGSANTNCSRVPWVLQLHTSGAGSDTEVIRLWPRTGVGVTPELHAPRMICRWEGRPDDPRQGRGGKYAVSDVSGPGQHPVYLKSSGTNVNLPIWACSSVLKHVASPSKGLGQPSYSTAWSRSVHGRLGRAPLHSADQLSVQAHPTGGAGFT